MAAREAPGAKPLLGPAKGPTIEALNVKLSNFQSRQPSVSQPAVATHPLAPGADEATPPPSDITHAFPSPGLKATLSPSDGERDRERGLAEILQSGLDRLLRV